VSASIPASANEKYSLSPINVELNINRLNRISSKNKLIRAQDLVWIKRLAILPEVLNRTASEPTFNVHKTLVRSIYIRGRAECPAPGRKISSALGKLALISHYGMRGIDEYIRLFKNALESVA
jgi:hypothetical protein